MKEKTVKFEKSNDDRIATEENISLNKKTRLAIPKTYKIFVDGKFPRTESGRYYGLEGSNNEIIANVSLSSRKDFRDAVTYARAAQEKWAKATSYNRGQILYRIAEVLESRSSQFIEELVIQGSSKEAAQAEVETSIDRLVYYAGWSDKFQQVFSSVNPVASSHFNFSVLEPTGLVSVIASEESGLLSLVTAIASTIVGGNSAVILASNSKPLSAITFGEVLHSSDVPAGVVNILTGVRKELIGHFSTHMDVNAIIYCGQTQSESELIQTNCISNLKRFVHWKFSNWFDSECESPYRILETQEVKTTWHPIGT